MPYIVAHEIHPNNETRLTLSRVRRVFSTLKEKAAQFLEVAVSEVRDLAASAPESFVLLDIRSEFRTTGTTERCNSHARTKFGKPAITRIFRAAGALDRFDSDVTSYLFLTATLPGDTDEAKWAIAEFSHEIIDGLKSWLSKRLLSRNEFYVWEHQKRGALHFHYCIHCPDKNVQAEISRNFKRQVVRLYDAIKEKHDYCVWGRWSNKPTRYKTAILQARSEVVYKSVGAYMAGYLGGEGNKHERDESHQYYPKRWFGVSRPLSALIKTYTEKEEHEFTSLGEASEYMAKIREDLLDDALTFDDFKHKVGEGKTHVSYHTPEIQAQLWQSKKMLTHNPHTQPLISEYISLALRSFQELQQCFRRYPSLNITYTPSLAIAFQDASQLVSLRSRAISRNQIRLLEKAHSNLHLSLNSPYTMRNLDNSLTVFSLATSRYHPQMTFNQFGWLNNTLDFVKPLDNLYEQEYRGTTSIRDSDIGDEIESSGRVPRDSDSPSYEQLIWSFLV